MGIKSGFAWLGLLHFVGALVLSLSWGIRQLFPEEMPRRMVRTLTIGGLVVASFGIAGIIATWVHFLSTPLLFPGYLLYRAESAGVTISDVAREDMVDRLHIAANEWAAEFGFGETLGRAEVDQRLSEFVDGEAPGVMVIRFDSDDPDRSRESLAAMWRNMEEAPDDPYVRVAGGHRFRYEGLADMQWQPASAQMSRNLAVGLALAGVPLVVGLGAVVVGCGFRDRAPDAPRGPPGDAQLASPRQDSDDPW